MILINSTIALGDGLRTFPTMIAFIKQSQEPVYVAWLNKELGDLFPIERYGGFLIDELPLESNHRVINISWHDYVQDKRP